MSPALLLPLLTALSLPAGVGLHLRAQLLPLCPGHGPRAAAAQGEQEGWECRDPRQAGLLHALLLRLSPRAGRARVFLPLVMEGCSQKENACLCWVFLWYHFLPALGFSPLGSFLGNLV